MPTQPITKQMIDDLAKTVTPHAVVKWRTTPNANAVIVINAVGQKFTIPLASQRPSGVASERPREDASVANEVPVSSRETPPKSRSVHASRKPATTLRRQDAKTPRR